MQNTKMTLLKTMPLRIKKVFETIRSSSSGLINRAFYLNMYFQVVEVAIFISAFLKLDVYNP